MSITSIICIIIYIISFAVGIGPIPFYLTSEMFKQVRPDIEVFSSPSFLAFHPLWIEAILILLLIANKTDKLHCNSFSQAPRTAACAIAQGVNWACNLILSLTFIYLQSESYFERISERFLYHQIAFACLLHENLSLLFPDGLGSYTFVPFLVIVVSIGFFVFMRIPETKGKSFEEISEVREGEWGKGRGRRVERGR